MSSHGANHQGYKCQIIDVMPRIRREYTTDQQHIDKTPQTAIDRIRADRLRRGLSAVALAKLANIPSKTIKYHEERNTSDDLISVEYLKQVAQAMHLPANHYLDDYLRWGDSGAYVADVRMFLKTQYPSLESAYHDLGVQEYAVTSWRVGRKRPPRWLYERIKQSR